MPKFTDRLLAGASMAAMTSCGTLVDHDEPQKAIPVADAKGGTAERNEREKQR